MAGPDAPPDDVPALDDRDRELDPRIVTVWRLGTAFGVLVPGAIITGVLSGIFGRRGLGTAIVIFVVAAVLTVGYPRARYDRWRWRLTDLAIELERGVVVRTEEALPYFRIQQIDVNQGPLDRMLQLASLEVTSASASGSVRLPGIAAEEAPRVRRALLARAAEAVGDHDGGVRDAV